MPQKCFLSPWAPGHWCLNTAVKLEEPYLPTALKGSIHLFYENTKGRGNVLV